jgi:virginiamycin A acetyltransferase
VHELSANPVGTDQAVPRSHGYAPSLAGRVKKHIRLAVKVAVQAGSLVVTFPFAALTAFGRLSPLFQFFGHSLALVPGLPGDYLRVAYYHLTLDRCSLYSRVSFGTFFAQSCATVGEGVYIGAYCVLGACNIGDRTQIASHVQSLAGQHQHQRATDGRILGADERAFTITNIGEDCWIGAAAILMADVGPRSTIGAGAIVTRPIPADVVAAGNPARILKRRTLDTPLRAFDGDVVC